MDIRIYNKVRIHAKQFLCLGMLVFLTASCEKDIDVDYRQVNPLYVAEATVTPSGTNVWLRTTQAVTDNSRDGHGVSGATITLSEVMPNGNLDQLATLQHKRDGHYTANIKGVPGTTYFIDINLDGTHYTSSSTMQEAPVINSFRFVWQKVVSERMLFAELKVQDAPNKASFYFMHIYRNNVGYRWAVMSDENNPNGELQQLFQCTTERDMNDNEEDALKDGDLIHLEVRAIDRLSYNYLYSMQVMSNSGTNPIANFTNGCLGYFSAYSDVMLNKVFYRAEVEEDK